jgi:pimeloyl-ACP methyl ester carboxylesterase
MMTKAYFNTHNRGTNVRFIRIKQASLNHLLRLAHYWAPAMTRRLLVRLFSTPSAYQTDASEAACLARGRVFDLPVNGHRIKAWKWGRGPGVLMMHGWNGRGIQFQAFIEPLVAAGYTAIAPDGPAHGESEGRHTNYFDFSDTARAFLAPDAGLDIRAVIGHSFGAAALINALAKDRHLLPALLVSPVLRLHELFVETARQFGVPDSITHTMIATYEAQYGYNLKRDNPVRLLQQIEVPILIAHDTDDRTISIFDAEQATRQHNTIELLTTRGLGHRRILSDPAVIEAALNHIGSLPSIRKISQTA